MSAPSAPIRVSLFGQGSYGHWLLDQLKRLAGIQLVTVWNPDSPSRPCPGGEGDVSAELGAAIDRDPADWAILALPSGVQAIGIERAMRNGAHVMGRLPLARNMAEAERLLRAQAETSRMLVPLRDPTDQHEIRAIRERIDRGELGAVRQIERRIWSPPLIDDGMAAGAPEEPDLADWLDQSLSPWIDALVQIAPLTIGRVDCAARRPERSARLEGGSWALRLAAEPDVSVCLELNRRTCLSDDSGWIISGSLGALRQQRQLSLTEEGEVFEENLEFAAHSSTALLQELFRGEDAAAALNERTILEQSARLMEAARRSVETRQWQLLPPLGSVAENG